MLSFSGITLPDSTRSYYRRARVLMYLVVFFIVGNFLMGILFPTFVFPFDFRTPGSLRNTLTDPRASDGTPLERGKVEASESLQANAGAFGRFSKAEIRATLEKDSNVPETIPVTVRRSYRSFLSPLGEPILGFPEGERYRVADTYYELRAGTLYPFVSEAAFLSHYPLSFAQITGPELLERFSVAEQWRGYRVGSLLAFGDGVFVVTSEEEVRPIGSADIFLRLGYRFEDVLSVSAEEVGIYRRGRIILLGAAHPDGTIFLDTDSETYSLLDAGKKRALEGKEYRDFLLSKNGAVVARGRDAEESARCIASLTFTGRSLKCQTSLDILADNLGNDYEITLANTPQPYELERLTLALRSEKSVTSARRLLTQVKVRFLIRFGYAQ